MLFFSLYLLLHPPCPLQGPDHLLLRLSERCPLRGEALAAGRIGLLLCGELPAELLIVGVRVVRDVSTPVRVVPLRMVFGRIRVGGRRRGRQG